MEAVPALTLNEDGVVVELPGMSTEPDLHQLQDAPKLAHICNGPFRGALLADAMGLGKSLTVAMTVMLSGKTRGAHHGVWWSPQSPGWTSGSQSCTVIGEGCVKMHRGDQCDSRSPAFEDERVFRKCKETCKSERRSMRAADQRTLTGRCSGNVYAFQ